MKPNTWLHFFSQAGVIEVNLMRISWASEEPDQPRTILISLQLTLILERTMLWVSVSRSSENTIREICENTSEGSLDPTNLVLDFSTSETITRSLKSWKFEQSVYGSTGDLHWFLYNGPNGREVVSSKPSVCALFQPRAWFKDWYSNSYMSFTKQVGVKGTHTTQYP